MKKSKLVQLLSTFSRTEINRFTDYLNSPYFNKNEEATELFVILEEIIFFIKAEEITKEYVWSKLYQKATEYDDNRFRLVMSELLKHAENYLAHQVFEEREVTKLSMLLYSLNARDLDKHFNFIHLKATKLQDQLPSRNREWYQNQLALEQMLQLFQQKNFWKNRKINISTVLETLDVFFLVSKLQYACEALNFKSIVSMELDVFLLDEVVEHISKQRYEEIPAIDIYFNILMLLQVEDKEPHYLKLRELMTSHGHFFPKAELQGIFQYALNYCIKKVNSGETQYYNHLLDLYKQALEMELLIDNKKLSPQAFKNIVKVGARVKEFEWVKEFIQQYRNKLPASNRETASNYNLAYYHYSVGNLDKVLPLLMRVEYEDVFYGLDSKILMLKIYYETEEIDALFSLLESFKVYLRRNKVMSAYHKTNNLNLIKFVKKLSNLPRGDKERIQKLRDEITETRQITDINWLLEKVDALL